MFNKLTGLLGKEIVVSGFEGYKNSEDLVVRVIGVDSNAINFNEIEGDCVVPELLVVADIEDACRQSEVFRPARDKEYRDSIYKSQLEQTTHFMKDFNNFELKESEFTVWVSSDDITKIDI